MYGASGTQLVGIVDGNACVVGVGCSISGLPVVVVGGGDFCTRLSPF